MKKYDIVGQQIVGVRRMSFEELEFEGWQDEVGGLPVVVILENGVKLYPARDEEGNGSGVMFGRDKKSTFMLYGD